jgi:hypothetical protein
MDRAAWTSSPDELGTFDSSVVRCIAGEFNQLTLARSAQSAGVDLRRRMAGLVSKHCRLTVDELGALGVGERRRLANEILLAEMDERETMPGELVPLRTRDFR